MKTVATNKTPEKVQKIVDRNKRDRFQRYEGLAVCEFECELVARTPGRAGLYDVEGLEPGHYYAVIVARTYDGYFNRQVKVNQPHFFESEAERDTYIRKRVADWSIRK